MRIACTSCNAAYELPPERVKPGRGVKCARCGTVWVPVALEDAAPEIRAVDLSPVPPMPEPAAVPEPVVPEPVVVEPVRVEPGVEPIAVPVAKPVARGSRAPVLLGWLVSLLLLAGLAWAAVTYRAAVVQAWPPAARAYKALGLDV